jgi:chromosome segregation ATPase
MGNDIRATELDLQLMYSDLNLILQQPPRFQIGVLQLQGQIRNAELALVSLTSSANQTSQQINSLSAQLAQVRNGVNQRLNELEREIKRVNGAKRRNMAKLTKIAKGPKVASGKRDSMRSRAKALRTYDDLVVELYRQDILDQLTN